MMTRPFQLGDSVWTSLGPGEIVGKAEAVGCDWRWPSGLLTQVTFACGPWVVRICNSLVGFASDDLTLEADAYVRATPRVLMPSGEAVARLLRELFGETA